MGNLLLRASVFMVVPLIIIYLLSIMNPSARMDSLNPRCCHLVFSFPLISGNLSGEGTVFPLLLLLRWQERNSQTSCIIKITKRMAISHLPDPGVKGELEEIVGRNCFRTMDRVNKMIIVPGEKMF